MMIMAACLLATTAAFGADKPNTDRDALLGTWTVAQGIYADGSLEKELEMEFTFKKDTMTNPMEDGELAYVLNEKEKTVSAKAAKSSIWIRYRIVDGSTMQFTEMRVTTEKGVTAIIGDKGTFKSMDLKRK